MQQAILLLAVWHSVMHIALSTLMFYGQHVIVLHGVPATV